MPYPSVIDSFTTKIDFKDIYHASNINALQTSIVSIETELGINPAGVASDLQTRLSNSLVLNVKDYGAKGNGIDDDTDAIQATSNALPNGGTIFFPRGTYLVGTGSTKTITIKSKQTVIGEGYYSCIYSKSTTADEVIDCAGAAIDNRNSGISIRNLRLLGFATTGALSGQYVIRFRYCDYCEVVGCWFEECIDEAILISQCEHINVIGNTVKGGTYMSDAVKLFEGVYFCVIANNTFQDIGRTGVQTLPSACGIELQGSGSDPVRYNTVIGNVAERCNEYGFRLEDAEYNAIVGNISRDNAGGIIANADSDYNIINSNIVVQNGGKGIECRGDNVAIAGNNISENASYGIWIKEAKYCAVSSNVVTLNSSHGILVENGDDNAIVGNVSTNGSGASIGIYLLEADNNTVTGNKTANNGGNGITLDNNSDYNIVIGNNYRNDGASWGTAVNNVIDHNIA